MTWARYDDEFPGNRKVVELIGGHGMAGLAAIGLHLLANTWSRHEGTAGELTLAQTARLCGDRKLAQRLTALLLEVGMADETMIGWEVHDFAEFHDPNDPEPNRSAAERKREVSAKRAAAGSLGGKASVASKRASKAEALLEQKGQQTSTPVPVPDPVDSQVLNHPPKLTARGRARGILETYGARMVASALAAGEHVISESGLAVYKANQAQPRLEAAMERYPDAPDHAFVDFLAGSTGALEGYRPRSSLADAPADPPSAEFKAALRLVHGELRTEATA